ncbi:DoxX family protein [Actinophytocola sp.]|uniref:DoxX family protein n=1 Tax=Actinophytocola sp. TaxID=1872138 RepID=UPI002ED085F0
MDKTLAAKPTVAPGRSRAIIVVLWVLEALLAIQFVIAGASKLIGDQLMVDMFAAIGAGQWLRYLVGLAEIAGAVGLLIPALSGLAALGLVALMVGATVTNVFVLEADATMPIVFLLVAALIAWGQWSRVTDLAVRLRR